MLDEQLRAGSSTGSSWPQPRAAPFVLPRPGLRGMHSRLDHPPRGVSATRPSSPSYSVAQVWLAAVIGDHGAGCAFQCYRGLPTVA